MTPRRLTTWGISMAIACALTGQVATHEAAHQAQSPVSASQAQPSPSTHISMEEIHRLGGVPPNWKFSFPTGDPQTGREVFAKLECYQCHAIQGEPFPQPSPQESAMGPELTGMGSHHPAEYLAESILNPNAVIITGPGYTDTQGLSIMPDYRDSLSVADLIDLVAYLKSLTGEHAHAPTHGHDHGPDHADHPTLLDTAAGDYRVRVVYHQVADKDRLQDGAAPQIGKPPAQNHLMAFITDVATGTSVPYLPVSATFHSPAGTPRTVQLLPMFGGEGFHYGGDVTLPYRPTKVTITIGATNIRVMPSSAGRFTSPQSISFEWQPHPSGLTSPDASHHPAQSPSGVGHRH